MFSRRRVPFVVGTIVAVLLLAGGGAQAAPGDRGGRPTDGDLAAPHVPGRILVKFKARADQARQLQAHARALHGGVLLQEMSQLDVQVVRVPPDKMAEALCSYRANPNVAYAEPDYIARPAYDPNDPKYGDGTQWGPRKIQADLAWDLSTGDPNAVVAVVDFGVDLEHPDLQSRLWTNVDEVPDNGIDDDANGYVDDVYGWDFANDDNDPQDDYGHGTHVAGIASAATDNGTGVAGVGFNSTIMAIKAGFGQTGNIAYSDITWSLYYAADNGADVINLSVGGYSNASYLQDAVDYAWSKGCVLVGAVGNNNSSDPFYPAAYDNVIAVSATDQTDTRTSWSNHGPHVSVAAPGLGIYSTYWDDDSTYAVSAGTSMAAPHVAGLAALLFAQDPTRSNADVRSLIEHTADDLGSEGWDEYYGFGRINAYQALSHSQATPTSTSEPPTPTPTPEASTPTPSPDNCDIHVGDLDGSAYQMGKNWEGSVTIVVHNADHNPVADATVNGSWSGGYAGSATCTTDDSGQCSVTTDKMKSEKSVSFTVTDVIQAAFTYRPSDNHDPDGDSDGTQIALSKNGSEASDPTPTPTSDDPTPTPTAELDDCTVHVGDLDRTTNQMGRNWEASVVIAVHDANHNLVAAATVSSSWTGGYVGSAACTTDATGECSVTSGKMKDANSITFTVNDVTHAAAYRPSDNHDPDGDSDGTQITVDKP